MVHFLRCCLVLMALSAGLSGCSSKSATNTASGPSKGGVSSTTSDGGDSISALKAELKESTLDEKYQTALLESLSFMTEKKYSEALIALKMAQQAKDGEEVRQQIAKVEGLLLDQQTFYRTLADIQAVIDQGQGEAAAQLAILALSQYGTGPEAERLAAMKRQADALVAATNPNVSTQIERLKREAEGALKENNLRSALLCFEQAFSLKDDSALQKQVETLRARLARYDAAMERAAMLRRQSQNLDEAVVAYQDAIQAWDTLQAQQELADAQLARQNRRERLAIADFEVQGDVGLAAYARAFAEELLPHFQRRFDLVDRGLTARLLDDLKIDSDDLVTSEQGRTELGKLARARYLLTGNISPLSGVTVHARLIDLKTGLIVQTARIVAATPEEASRQLSQLAAQLLMSDEEKLAYSKQQSLLVAPGVVNPGGSFAAVPVYSTSDKPIAINYSTARPAAYGTLQPDEFDRLPPIAAGNSSLPVYSAELERPLRLKLLALQVELGDNLYRRGLFREALARYQLARELDPANFDILMRINQCLVYLPPVQPVVTANRRERLALLNFFVIGNPHNASPGLSTWTPENLAPYFAVGYEVIDRGEVDWMMGRLGLTLGDIIRESGVRRWLGRALGVRYFVVGRIQAHDGLTITTSLLDTEQGWETGRGQVVVHHLQELKLRLPELARQTISGAVERARLEQEAAQWEAEYLRAQEAYQRGQYALALEITGKLRLRQPLNIRIGYLFNLCEEKNRLLAMEQARLKERERQRFLAEQTARRQAELILAAERARQEAIQRAAQWAEVDRRRQRELAQNQLLSQARLALQVGKFNIAIQLFDGAVAFRPNDEAILREMAQARIRWEENRRRTIQSELQHQAEAERRQRELAMAASRQLWVSERQLFVHNVLGFQIQQRQQDVAEYTRLLDQALRLKAQGRYDQAASMLEIARRIHHTDEVDRLLTEALMEQARAQAKAEDAARFAELEKKLAQETARRKQFEQQAQQNWALYQAALKQAQEAQRNKNLSLAVAKYQEASRWFQTPEVVTGLQSAQAAQAQEQQRLAALAKDSETKARRSAEVAKYLLAGKEAEKAKKFDEATIQINKAKELDPLNIEVLTTLTRLEQARNRAIEDQNQAVRLKDLLSQAENRAKAKQFDMALSILAAAQKLAPSDQQIAASITKVKSQQAADAQAVLTLKQKEEEARKQVALRIEQEEKAKQQAAEAKKQAETALSTGDLRTAESALATARKLAPNDPTLLKLQQELAKVKSQASHTLAQADAKARLDAAAQSKTAAQAQQQQGKIGDLLKQVQAATAKKDFAVAEKLLVDALALDPTNLGVGRAQRELQTARQNESQSKVAMNAVDKKKQDDELAKKKAEFTRLMKDGREALASEDYEKATKLFTDAKALNPDDADAALFLGMAKRDSERAKAEAEVARKEAEANKKREMEATKAEIDLKKKAEEELRRKLAMDAEAKKRADALKALNKQQYDAAVLAGKQAVTAKKYDDAIKAFEKALQLVPDDKDATAQLAQVRKLKAEPITPPFKNPPPSHKTPPAQLLTQAVTLQKQQKWEEALSLYRQVLSQNPTDQTAKNGAKLCEFEVNFDAGRAALAKKDKEAAIKAFEAALKLMPGHQETQKLLKQAQDLK